MVASEDGEPSASTVTCSTSEQGWQELCLSLPLIGLEYGLWVMMGGRLNGWMTGSGWGRLISGIGWGNWLCLEAGIRRTQNLEGKGLKDALLWRRWRWKLQWMSSAASLKPLSPQIAAQQDSHLQPGDQPKTLAKQLPFLPDVQVLVPSLSDPPTYHSRRHQLVTWSVHTL